MKALIIGASGFVGPYLIQEIQQKLNCEVVATTTQKEHPVVGIYGQRIVTMDMQNKDAVRQIMVQERPYYIFHLAAQSSVAKSWKEPELTVSINIKGAIHILDAIRELDYSPRILFVGSGEEYGYIEKNKYIIDESYPLNPGNVYAVTKACQNMLATIYANAYHLSIIMVRAFNHFGPGQSPTFVASDFCKQAVMIEMGLQEPVLHVGNLSAKRDFTDVRDVAAAYVALIQFGRAGETYNVGSGKALAIQDILDEICAQSTAEIRVEVDPSKLRPIDIPIIEANISKIINDTGWHPSIPLHQSICETLDYWRKTLGE